MRNGNQHSDIFITPETLQQCLDAMAHASQTEVPAVFYGLTLVDEYSADPDMPPLPETSTFPIFSVLSDLIREEYLCRLQATGLTTNIDSGTRESGLQRIAESSRTGSEDLIGWSFLYYHYVRVDLGIMAADFAKMVGVVPRTVRRYRRRAVAELCEVLIAAEHKACRASRLRRIEGMLIYDNPRFIGRTAEIAGFCQHIAANLCANVIVTGEAGIGKSAFVSRALRQFLKERQDDVFDVIIWCDGHGDNTSIIEEVKEKFAARLSPRLGLEDWQLMIRIAVVIDNISASTTNNEIDELFQWLAHCLVVIITDRPCSPTDADLFHIVTDLSKDKARDLISRQLLDVVGVGEEIAEHEIDGIYAITKGNPGLIGHVSIVRGLELKIGKTSGEDSNTVKPKLDYRMGKLPQSLIVCLCLLPDDSFSPMTLVKVFEPVISHEHIHLLFSMNLIETVGTVGEELSVPQFVKGKATSIYRQIEFRDTLSMLVHKLTEGLLIDMAFCEACLRQAFASDLLGFRQQIELLLLQGRIQSGHALLNPLAWIRTYELAKSEVDLKLAIHLKYLKLLRKVGRWHNMVMVADDLVSRFRAMEMFLEEAKIRLERSRGFRLMGNYRLAIEDLRFIEFIAGREDDEDLADEIAVEKARIALDRGRGHQSIDFLSHISVEVRHDAQVQLMSAEAYLLIGDIGESRRICEELLAKADLSGEVAGRVFGLLGNIALRRGIIPDAQMFTLLAARIFRETFQLLLLARAWSNLASIHAARSEIDEAVRLLVRARELQELLGDKIGLVVTGRNLQRIAAQGITP